MKMFPVMQEHLCNSASHNKLHFIKFNSSPAGFVPKLPQLLGKFKTSEWE